VDTGQFQFFDCLRPIQRDLALEVKISIRPAFFRAPFFRPSVWHRQAQSQLLGCHVQQRGQLRDLIVRQDLRVPGIGPDGTGRDAGCQHHAVAIQYLAA